VDGTSDDLDVAIEGNLKDAGVRDKYQLGSVNSVNIARVLMQVVGYFYVYVNYDGDDICREAAAATAAAADTATADTAAAAAAAADSEAMHPWEQDLEPGEICFFVPTGAAGHCCAGSMARLMGLPCRIVAATNSNGAAMAALLRDGCFAQGPFYQTLAPAMDIQVPYNVERILCLLRRVRVDGIRSPVGALMEELRAVGTLAVTPDDGAPFRRIGLYACDPLDDVGILATIREYYAATGLALCPHSAVGLRAALDSHGGRVGRAVVMGCASAAKFPDIVSAGIADLIPQHSSVVSSPVSSAPSAAADKDRRTVLARLCQREENAHTSALIDAVLDMPATPAGMCGGGGGGGGGGGWTCPPNVPEFKLADKDQWTCMLTALLEQRAQAYALTQAQIQA
jgi:threonine synthase